MRRHATRALVGWDTGTLRNVLSRKVPKAMPIRLLRAMNRKAFDASLSQESTAPARYVLTFAFGLTSGLTLQQLAQKIAPQRQPTEKQQPSKTISIQGKPACSLSTEKSPGTTITPCAPPLWSDQNPGLEPKWPPKGQVDQAFPQPTLMTCHFHK